MAVSNDKKQVTIYMPRRIYVAVQEAAASIGQSASTFIVLAAAQRLRNWEDPLTGEKYVKAQTKAGRYRGYNEPDLTGWGCTHPACACPAVDCQRPEAHQQQDLWVYEPYPVPWAVYQARGYQHDDVARRQWEEHRVNVYEPGSNELANELEEPDDGQADG